MSNSWKTLSSKYVYQNPWIKVREEDIIRPSGNKGMFGIVDAKDFAVAIAKVDNKFYMVEQYRYPVKKNSLEFPMGSIEPNESLEEGVKRELKEETGLISDDIKKIGFLYLANSFCTIGYHIFIVDNCTLSEQKLEASEEGMKVKTLTFDELKSQIKNGQITDGPTVSAFGLYLLNKE
jgi:8-oxo-dGTP pyrophosphatase MutT (NUDIX family)